MIEKMKISETKCYVCGEMISIDPIYGDIHLTADGSRMHRSGKPINPGARVASIEFKDCWACKRPLEPIIIYKLYAIEYQNAYVVDNNEPAFDQMKSEIQVGDLHYIADRQAWLSKESAISNAYHNGEMIVVEFTLSQDVMEQYLQDNEADEWSGPISNFWIINK